MVVNFGVNVLAIIVHVRGVIVDRVIDVSDVGVIFAVDGKCYQWYDRRTSHCCWVVHGGAVMFQLLLLLFVIAISMIFVDKKTECFYICCYYVSVFAVIHITLT